MPAPMEAVSAAATMPRRRIKSGKDTIQSAYLDQKDLMTCAFSTYCTFTDCTYCTFTDRA